MPDLDSIAREIASEAVFEDEELVIERMVLAALRRVERETREECARTVSTFTPEDIHRDDLYAWRDTAATLAAAIRMGEKP